MDTNLYLNKFLRRLIAMAVLVTAIGLFFPVTSASFSPWYGSIAKNIVLSHNWTNLTLSNQDWLDKPHLPFWLTAFSFKLFGITSFAYVLPGFLFHLLGAIYTYKLSNYLYNNNTLALLATLIYLTVLHLMLSAIDVRAEAYLLGQIMPAVYYWLHYDQKFSLKALLLGAFFTGLALMTKGIFVIITIISGLVCWWIFSRRLANLISFKWWLALALALVCASPELIALYLQFDAHPEKIVFGHTHVSGIRWFFIDSQFGRFFGTGPIVTTNPPALHQLFYVHTFLWAFLPWTLVYPLAVYTSIRKFKLSPKPEQKATILLLGYFWLSLAMFSLTSFQVDHYTNIIFPFAAILCAKLLFEYAHSNHKIFTIQQGLSLIMLAILGGIIGHVFSGWLLLVFVLGEIGIIFMLIKNWEQPPFIKAILIPVSTICWLFIVAMTINGYLYHQYDSGFLAAQITNHQPQIPVVDYNFDSRALEFFSHNHYYKVQHLSEVSQLPRYYAVMPDQQWQQLASHYPTAQLIAQVHGNSNDKIFPCLGNERKLAQQLIAYDIILFIKP